MDGFHLPRTELVRLGRRERMGAPDTFDVEGFIAALERLQRPSRVVFVAPDDRLGRERLVARHVAYGKSPAEAEEWVARSDDPNAALVAATAHRADEVVTGAGT